MSERPPVIETVKLKFPLTITSPQSRSISAKIHKATQIQNGCRYAGYMVIYWLLGRRNRIWRSDLEEARIVAQQKCDEIATGEHQTPELNISDRKTYFRAIQTLTPIGVELDVATRDYVSAVKDLPSGTTLKEAVDFFRRRNATAFEKRSVRQVVDEMLAAKRAANKSVAHINDLESRLTRFADAFQMNIGSVSGILLQAWLDAMNRSGRTKQNYLQCVSALFNFAIKRKYLPKDAVDEIKAVEKPTVDASEVAIFTPDEMRDILSVARPEMIPWLTLGGFAGLRSAEIARLEWGEISLAERQIQVKAAKAKTRQHRIVPIPENLAQWLMPHAKENGTVVPFGSWWNQIAQITAAVNARRGDGNQFKWVNNGLRHSFGTYRLAEIKDAGQVSLELGNTPAMVFRHYRKPETLDAAKRWFAIIPNFPAN